MRQQAAVIALAARNTPIGFDVPGGLPGKFADEMAREATSFALPLAAPPTAVAAAPSTVTAVTPEPLAPLQWDMQIGATADGSLQPSSRAATTSSSGSSTPAIDGTHPDIAPNFDARSSRNFTADIPLIDGPAPAIRPLLRRPGRTTTTTATAPTSPARSPRRSTASASPASPPRVDLVNLRAGQDSGYFFLQPTVDALTYAGDIGIDVVNMSFYVDPWLFNCADNPADTPEEQAEQRADHRGDAARAAATPTATASRWSRPRATSITDLGTRTFDRLSSPDYPPDTAHERTITDTLRLDCRRRATT